MMASSRERHLWIPCRKQKQMKTQTYSLAEVKLERQIVELHKTGGLGVLQAMAVDINPFQNKYTRAYSDIIQ